MIQSELSMATDHANTACRSGAHAWCSIEGVPAAGRLGVPEEGCTASFEESHWMPGVATLGGLPCEYCGAAV